MKRSFVKMFSFRAIIASRGYHAYKETSLSNAKMDEVVKVELETDAKSFSTDPYTCTIQAKHSYFIGWKTVGHIPREISRYGYFLIKAEKGKVFGTLKASLLLTFSCKEKWVIDTVEEFVENFYSLEYSSNLH